VPGEVEKMGPSIWRTEWPTPPKSHLGFLVNNEMATIRRIWRNFLFRLVSPSSPPCYWLNVSPNCFSASDAFEIRSRNLPSYPSLLFYFNNNLSLLPPSQSSFFSTPMTSLASYLILTHFIRSTVNATPP
jgi:hypothetical protein